VNLETDPHTPGAPGPGRPPVRLRWPTSLSLVLRLAQMPDQREKASDESEAFSEIRG